LLAQTILDKYPLRKHLTAFNETHILEDEDVRVVGVKKKIHKRKHIGVDSEGFISRIEKVLLVESMCSANASIYCTMNCY
jgi:hypothetical protein